MFSISSGFKSPVRLALLPPVFADAPFPVIDEGQSVDSVVKLMSKSNPAVLVRRDGTIAGILTRSDLLHYLMAR